MYYSLFAIKPYKHEGSWVFDDSRFGLESEPFLLGADLLISYLTEKIPNADQGFCVFISAIPVPGYLAKLELVREDEKVGGYWYKDSVSGTEGWFSPSLSRLFKKIPKEIYVKPEPKPVRKFRIRTRLMMQ